MKSSYNKEDVTLLLKGPTTIITDKNKIYKGE